MLVGAPDRSSTARRALCAVMALAATPQSGGVGTRTLGVDFGLRRVGLALSGGFAPLPLSVLPCDDDDAADDFRDIARRSARIAVGEGASQIVVGMPLVLKLPEGEAARLLKRSEKAGGGSCEINKLANRVSYKRQLNAIAAVVGGWLLEVGDSWLHARGWRCGGRDRGA